MDTDHKTYTDRSNCIRAARKVLGENAKPHVDFDLTGCANAWQWQKRDESIVAPKQVQGAAAKAEARGLPPILKRSEPTKKQALNEVLKTLPMPEAKASRADSSKAGAALKAKPAKGKQNGQAPARKIAQDGSDGKLPAAPQFESETTTRRWVDTIAELKTLIKDRNVKALKAFHVDPGNGNRPAGGWPAIENYRKSAAAALEAQQAK
jgi:hypothetical protein